jgi:hypothetical protein
MQIQKMKLIKHMEIIIKHEIFMKLQPSLIKENFSSTKLFQIMYFQESKTCPKYINVSPH